MYRLISINPDIALEPESEGHEFCCYVFDQFPNVTTHKVTSSKEERVISAVDNATPTQNMTFITEMKNEEHVKLQKMNNVVKI